MSNQPEQIALHVSVKESPGDMLFIYIHSDLALNDQAYLFFPLSAGTTLLQANEIAAFMNNNLGTVGYFRP